MAAQTEHPLKSFLDRFELSQCDAAARLNCAGSTISRILKDDRWPSGEMIDAIERETKGAITFKSFQSYFADRQPDEIEGVHHAR